MVREYGLYHHIHVVLWNLLKIHYGLANTNVHEFLCVLYISNWKKYTLKSSISLLICLLSLLTTKSSMVKSPTVIVFSSILLVSCQFFALYIWGRVLRVHDFRIIFLANWTFYHYEVIFISSNVFYYSSSLSFSFGHNLSLRISKMERISASLTL